MNQAETKKLLALLTAIYPTSKNLRSKEAESAFYILLSDAEYKEAESAALQYARNNVFPPNPPDIAVLIPKREDTPYKWELEPGRKSRNEPAPWMLKYMTEEYDQWWENRIKELNKGSEKKPRDIPDVCRTCEHFDESNPYSYCRR